MKSFYILTQVDALTIHADAWFMKNDILVFVINEKIIGMFSEWIYWYEIKSKNNIAK